MTRLTALFVSLALLVIAAPATHAATKPKPGDCYARADVAKDYVDTSSKVDCSKPHAVQVLSVAPLPKIVRNRDKVALGNSRSAVSKAFVAAGYRSCNAKRQASGIWPKKGNAVVAALGNDAKGFFPAVQAADDGMGTGWVLPDQKAWSKGVRSLLCVVYNGNGNKWVGDLSAMETSDSLPQWRFCTDLNNATVSCDQPHGNEVLFFWYATGTPPGERWTAEQFAPLDAKCKAAADVLVGANRADLVGIVVLFGKANVKEYGGETATLGCSITRQQNGTLLPPGTVVGLGDRPLG